MGGSLGTFTVACLFGRTYTRDTLTETVCPRHSRSCLCFVRLLIPDRCQSLPFNDTDNISTHSIASFFPPTTTIRLYQRRLLATTSSELGSIYCSILSFANTKHEPEIQEIIASLIAVRNKLNKSAVMVDNVAYEVGFRLFWVYILNRR